MEASNCHSWFGCGFHAVGQGLFSCTLNWLDDVAETWAWEKAVRDGKTTTSCVCPCLPLPILPTTAIKHSSPTAVFCPRIVASCYPAYLRYLGTFLHQVDIRGLHNRAHISSRLPADARIQFPHPAFAVGIGIGCAGMVSFVEQE